MTSYSLLREEWEGSQLAATAVDVRGEVPAAFVCAERRAPPAAAAARPPA